MEMNHQQIASTPSPEPVQLRPSRPRCQHVSRTGRPCRNLGLSAKQPFCKSHVPPGSQEDLTFTLLEAAQNFNTPEGVNSALYTIFFALVEGYLTERKAGILTYVAQTILNSHRATAQLQRMAAEAEAKRLPMWPTYPSSSQSWSSEDDPSAETTGSSGSANPPSPPVPDASSTEAVSSSPAQPAAAASVQPPANSGGTKPSLTTAPPPPPVDLNHFFPRDPSLPRSLQDPDRLPPPPPAREDLERRNARYHPPSGCARHPGARSFPHENEDDWKIINGR